MTKDQKENSFANLEQNKESVADVKSENNGGELKIDDFSDTAIGEKVKYNRPALDNSEDTIEKFQVFLPDTNKEEAIQSQSGNCEYWPATVIMTYGSKNADGINNREYLSGAKVFKNRDGSPSDVQFWYSGSGTQCAYMWEKVAKAKNITAEELSPREFIAFLNNKPKVKIAEIKYDNFVNGRKQGLVSKNMIGEFL